MKEALRPRRAALFLVVAGGADPEKALNVLRPLAPRVLRTTLSEATYVDWRRR